MDAKARALQALTELYPDPTIRQARQEELGDAGLEALGKSVLRQDDYSRSMNELGGQRAALTAKEQEARDLYEANKAWFDQKQKDLEELDRLRLQVKPNGSGDPAKPDAAKPDPKYITREDLDATERGAVAFFSDLNALSLQHFQQFGETLDVNALLRDRRVQEIGLRGVYAETHKEQLDARAAKIKQEAEDKVRADERQKVLASMASQHHPYPVRGNEPSTLDMIEAAHADPTKAVAKTVDEMAAEYARLSAARTGVPV